MFETREASQHDIEQIVMLHMTAFPGFFLTRMGPGFLRELYTGFLQDVTGKLLVASNNGEVLGFAAGTSSPDTFFKHLRNRKWPVFILRAIPAAMKSPGLVIRKLWSAVRYKGDTPGTLEGGALLSSLAVSPAARKQGVGNALVELFCNFAREHQNSLVYVITDKDENTGVIKFYENLGFIVEATLTKQNNREMYRLVKYLDGS